MTTKTKILSGLAVLALLIGGFWGKRTYNEVGELHQELHRNMNMWIYMQWSAFYSFEYSLAEALSTSSVSKRQRYLKDAAIQASYLREYTSYGAATVSALHPLSDTFFRFGDIGNYLNYASTEKGVHLKPAQVANLQIMLQYVSKMRPYMKELNAFTSNNVNYKPDSSEKVSRIASELAQEVGRLPAIGKNDKAFNDYLYSQFPYKVRKPGSVFQGEKTLNGAELARRAKAFMGDFWLSAGGMTIRSTSGIGGDIQFGGTYSLALYDDKQAVSSPYIVELTRAGGHILRVRFDKMSAKHLGEPAGELDNNQAISLAKEWIGRWGEEPLELYKTRDEYTNLRVTFIPVRENVPFVQQTVDIVIDRKNGRLFELDASGYFSGYQGKVPLQAKLSPGQAKSKVNGLMQITGVPVLEARDGKLVYAIPVEGIEGVTQLYINAINGNEEGFEYVG